mgnify:CR=1 FL=1
MEQRNDVGEILKYEFTPEGYLNCFGTAARVGIQTYYNLDGTERKEFRPPEEVSDLSSLATYGLTAHTVDHPSEDVNSKNSKKYLTGLTHPTVWYKKGFVNIGVCVTDAKAIEEIVSGRKRQLSCGYTTDVIDKPGVWQGQRYDAIQTNIRVNHVSSVEEGRAGPDVKLHLDSEENLDLDNKELVVYTYKKDMSVQWTDGKGKIKSIHYGKYHNLDGTKENPVLEIRPLGSEDSIYKLASEISMDMNEEKTDSVDTEQGLQQSDTRADALEQRIRSLEAMLASKRQDEATLLTEKARNVQYIAQLESEKSVAVNEVEKIRRERNDAISNEVSKRIDAWNKARNLLPQTLVETPDPAMNASAIMRCAIEHTSPEVNLDGASDEYVKGCFEVISNRFEANKTPSYKQAIARSFEGMNLDTADARNKARQESENAWMSTN